MRATTARRRTGLRRTSPSNAVIDRTAASMTPARVRAVGCAVGVRGPGRLCVSGGELVMVAGGAVSLDVSPRLPMAIPIASSATAATTHARTRLRLRCSRARAGMLTSRPGMGLLDRPAEILEERDDRRRRADEERGECGEERAAPPDRGVVVVTGLRCERPHGGRDEQAGEGGEQSPEGDAGDEALEG